MDAAGGNLFWRGVLMNVLNPKVALFFLAFLPQFVDPAAGAVAWQMLGLGLLFTALVVLLFGATGLFAGGLGQWLRARPAVNRYLGGLASAVFVVLALRLALTQP